MNDKTTVLIISPVVKEIVYQIQDHIEQMENLDDGPDGKYATSPYLPMMQAQRKELEHNTLVYLMQLFDMVETAVEAIDAE